MPPVERVRISAIAAGGAGVGRLADGRAVFVHRTAPDEEADVLVLEQRARFARAELVTLLTPSRDRRAAPCPHYDRCGGCTLEHLAYPAQLDAKARIVADALRRIGGLEVDLPEVVASPAEFRYRNRLSLTLVRAGPTTRAGFHELGRPGEILDIGGECLLPEPALASALDALRAQWGPGALLLPSGRQLRLTLRITASGRATLLVEGGGRGGHAKRLLAAVPALAAIWHRPRPGDEAVLLAGEPYVEERWRGERIPVRGSMFLQVNRAAAGALEGHVLALGSGAAMGRVVDAYAGVGTLARALAAGGARVTAIESEGDAVAVGASLGGGVEWIHGRVEDRIAGALPADLVIVNPPRTGLDIAVCRALADQPPPRVVYVSCDPATLARDLRRLEPALRLRTTRCFDLFPQTSHVETVAELRCATT